MAINIQVDDTITLELTGHQHAAELLQLVSANRHHLRQFLPWVDSMLSLKDFSNYIESSKQRYASHLEITYMIMAHGVMIGRIGINNIDLTNKAASIGYWLAEPWVGKGIITRCCKVMIDEGFHRLQLNRLEIRAATENVKSQAIPERLGFKKEGIIRQGEFVNTQFVDLYVYSLLRQEWNGQ